MSNLRVLYLARDETANRVGWVDISQGEPNATNRTLTGKFDFVSPGGYNETNERLFRIARRNSALAISEIADLSITGSASPEPVRAGNNLTYSWSVANNGPQAATGVGFMQILDSGTEFISATSSLGECDNPQLRDQGGERGRVRYSLGSLANGAIATITVIVKVSDFGLGYLGEPNISIDSNAYISGEQEDNNPNNDSKALFSTARPSLNKPPAVQINSPNGSIKESSHHAADRLPPLRPRILCNSKKSTFAESNFAFDEDTLMLTTN